MGALSRALKLRPTSGAAATTLCTRARSACGGCKQQLLQQPRPQPFPLRLSRVLHVPAGPDDAGVCVHVSAAARVRVRCSEVARLAVGLASNTSGDQGAGQLCGWAACIMEHVYVRLCHQVEVRQRAA
jgi:hypothetical protein